MRQWKDLVPVAAKDAVKRPFQQAWRWWRTRPFRCESLLILDDFFPNLLSAFRIAEYNAYLTAFPDARVLSTSHLRPGPEQRGLLTFDESLADYRRIFPQFADRVVFNHGRWKPSARLAYMVFLNQAYWNLPLLEANRIPFLFTLYPGAGMRLDCPESDRQLRRVFASPWFRGVITTQNVTRDYLLQHRYCPREMIHHIYGGALPVERLVKYEVPPDDPVQNICFVADKYTPDGADKGFDLFLGTARRLADRFPSLRFHVVGGFSVEDCPDPVLRERVTFYGRRNTEFFPSFYPRMQIILSPNRPFVMLPGAYDGFPTGGCAEAAACGTAMFITDPLGMNESFVDGQELVIIPPDANRIADLVTEYVHDAPRLNRLRTAGQARCRNVFSSTAQLTPRVELLRRNLGTSG